MATVIKLKKSETASSVPTTSNLAVGEVAVNTADQKIYVRDSSDNIVTVANKGEELGTVLAMTVALGQDNMATPTSKSTLKEHCLRALGKPVIDVNVDPDQCDDRIDDALQYFAEYHMDGVERMYLKYKMTSDQIIRGQSNSTTNVTDTVDNSGGAYFLSGFHGPE